MNEFEMYQAELQGAVMAVPEIGDHWYYEVDGNGVFKLRHKTNETLTISGQDLREVIYTAKTYRRGEING